MLVQLPFFFYGAWAFAVGEPRVQKPVRSRFAPHLAAARTRTALRAQAPVCRQAENTARCARDRRWFTG